jgi:hypothetical protein
VIQAGDLSFPAALGPSDKIDAYFIVPGRQRERLATSTLRRSRRAASKLLTRDARRVTRQQAIDIGQGPAVRLVIDCVRPPNGGRVN